MTDLKQLAQQIKDNPDRPHRTILDYFLARLEDGELVAAIGYVVTRQDDDGKFMGSDYRQLIIRANGERIDELSEQTFRESKERKPYPHTKTTAGIEDAIYRDFYEAWVEIAPSNEEKERRRSLIDLHWIAVGMDDYSGGY